MLNLKLQYFAHLMQRNDPLEKTLIGGKDGRQEKKGVTEDEMVGWHHRLNGHEFEQTPGDSVEGQDAGGSPRKKVMTNLDSLLTSKDIT